MLVKSNQLLQGERLLKCSDEAQLHFPRLAAITNGFGRLELNMRAIRDAAYTGFRTRPSLEQLNGWLKEYEDASMLFVYHAADGTPWGLWRGFHENMLPRYKTADDVASPVPPEEAVAAFDQAYAGERLKSDQFFASKKYFGNVPKVSAGEVVGEAVGEDGGKAVGEGKQKHTAFQPVAETRKSSSTATAPIASEPVASAKPAASPQKPLSSGTSRQQQLDVANREAEQVYEIYPHQVGKATALKSIRKAIRILRARGIENPVSHLRQCIENWLASRRRDEAAEKFVRNYPDPAKWFREGRYDDSDCQPKPKSEWVEVDPVRAQAELLRDLGVRGGNSPGDDTCDGSNGGEYVH